MLSNGLARPKGQRTQPLIWSPAARRLGSIVASDWRSRVSAGGRAADAQSFMLTPLTIAMPRPMAEALGWPKTPIGFADIVALANEPAGLGKFGHPEWGPFPIGKTSPNFSPAA